MGIVAALLSSFFASSKDLLSKRFSFQIDGTTSTFASFFFALPFYTLALAVLYALGYETFEVSASFVWLCLLRAATDTFAEGMKMHAFAHGDISLVASFFALSPLLLLFTSPLLTSEQTSALGIAATVLVVAGSLVLVYRPSSKSWKEQRKGIILASGAALFFSLNSCFDRLAMRLDPSGGGTPAFAGFAMTFLSAAFLTPLVAFRPDRLRLLGVHGLELALRGILEVAFMVGKLYAMRHMEAPYVVVLIKTSTLLSILGGRVFFRETDFLRRFAAGSLILAGVVAVVLKKA